MDNLDIPIVSFSNSHGADGTCHNNFDLYSMTARVVDKGVEVVFNGIDFSRVELVEDSLLSSVGIGKEQFIKEILLYYKTIKEIRGYVFNFNNILKGLQKRVLFAFVENSDIYTFCNMFISTDVGNYRQSLIKAENPGIFSKGVTTIYELYIHKNYVLLHSKVDKCSIKSGGSLSVHCESYISFIIKKKKSYTTSIREYDLFRSVFIATDVLSWDITSCGRTFFSSYNVISDTYTSTDVY